MGVPSTDAEINTGFCGLAVSCGGDDSFNFYIHKIGVAMTREEKQNRILHAIKQVAYARKQLDDALDELVKELINDNEDRTSESCGN